MNQSEIFVRDITEKITTYRQEISSCTMLGYTDIAKNAENFVKRLFNITYGYKLINSNETISNADAIDMYDESGEISYQVTANSRGTKVNEALEGFIKKELYKKYPRFKVFILTEKQGSYKIKTKNTGFFDFDPKRDILDFDDLLQDINNVEFELQEQIFQFVRKALPHAVDKIHKRRLKLLWLQIRWLLLVSVVIVGALFCWNMLEKERSLPVAAAVFDQQRKGSLKAVILPFKHDNETYVQSVIASTLRDINKRDSMDLDIRDPNFLYGVGLEDSIKILFDLNKADIIIWGEVSKVGDEVYYKLKYRTMKWPGIENDAIEFEPFIMSEVSSGNINGNLTTILKYLEAIMGYHSIAEVSELYKTNTPASLNVARKVEKSIRVFNQILRDDDNKASLSDSIHLYLANSHQFLKEHALTIRHYLDYLIGKPRDAKAYNNLAVAFSETLDYEKAIAYADTAVLYSNGHPSYIFNKGLFLYLSKKYWPAIKEFEKVQKTLTQKDQLFYYMAACYSHTENYRIATKYIDKSLLYKQTKDGYIFKAELLEVQEKWGDAFENYKRASSYKPETMEVFFKSLIMLEMDGRNTEIVEIAGNMIKYYPRIAEFYSYRGAANMNLMNVDNAIGDFTKAIDLNHKFAQAYINRSRAHVIKGNFDESKKDSLMYIKFK